MMKTAIFTASAALLLAATASAQQPQQSGNFLEQLLGGMFGNTNQAAEQTLETDWNQGERPFERRRQQLDARIDAAVRDGSIGRNEADAMRREYDDIVRMEAQYSADGPMQPQERSVLRSRYRALTQRVGGQSYGQDNGGQNSDQDVDRWQPLMQRNGLFEQRLATRLRSRSLTQAQAVRLRADWRSLMQLETRYAYDGIDAREQADLWARYNLIDNRLGGSATSGFGNDGNTQRWRQMETRLIAAQRAGRINTAQTAQMRVQMNDLERLDAAYARGGYGTEQRNYLMRRYGELDAAMGAYRR